MNSESLLGKRISTVGILINRSSSSIVQAFNEAGYKMSSASKIKEEHLLVLQDYIKKSKSSHKTLGLKEHVRVRIAKECIKLGLKGKTIEQAAAILKIGPDYLLAFLEVKAPTLNLLSVITDGELLIIREYLEKKAGAKRLQEKAKLKALRNEQLNLNTPSKKRIKKQKHYRPDEFPKFKIIYTPHPKY
jgi:hypothetical protein